MVAAKNVGSGLANTQQVFYGLIDFTLHDKYDPTSSKTTTEVVKELQEEVTLYPFLEGTHMQAAFGHLMGYAAGYYSYLWALVYAQDMFSVFEKNGVMDVKTGLKYRDIILSNGGSRDELEMVREFLGREPNQDAFFRSIGLDVKEMNFTKNISQNKKRRTTGVRLFYFTLVIVIPRLWRGRSNLKTYSLDCFVVSLLAMTEHKFMLMTIVTFQVLFHFHPGVHISVPGFNFQFH